MSEIADFCVICVCFLCVCARDLSRIYLYVHSQRTNFSLSLSLSLSVRVSMFTFRISTATSSHAIPLEAGYAQVIRRMAGNVQEGGLAPRRNATTPTTTITTTHTYSVLPNSHIVVLYLSSILTHTHTPTHTHTSKGENSKQACDQESTYVRTYVHFFFFHITTSLHGPFHHHQTARGRGGSGKLSLGRLLLGLLG